MSRRAPSEERIKAAAYALGFDLAGIARLGEMPTAGAYERWLARGYAGTMQYLERGAEARADSRRPFPGVRSAIVVALDYGGRQPSGPVARYARGDDYHHVMTERLHALHCWLDDACGASVHGKAYVDTGPVLERDLARQAGLGWFGKNAMLVNPRRGSFLLLGALFVDLDLAPDSPFDAERCGTCRRCIEACPTEAIVAEGVVDARRCISYLTIELREGIPVELREKVGGLLFGCDVCQEVCPWNVRFSRDFEEPAFAARPAIAGKDAQTLAREILAMDPERFRAAFKDSPLKRPKLAGLKRNAAVVLGNVGDERDIELLAEAADDPEPLVREHVAWALRRRRAQGRQGEAPGGTSARGAATDPLPSRARPDPPRASSPARDRYTR